MAIESAIGQFVFEQALGSRGLRSMWFVFQMRENL